MSKKESIFYHRELPNWIMHAMLQVIYAGAKRRAGFVPLGRYIFRKPLGLTTVNQCSLYVITFL